MIQGLIEIIELTAGRTSEIKRGEPVQNPDKIVKARMAADVA